ncbi:hypothetical protein PspS35_14495 [Pseudomonas sp. S35]|uniref:hypothetical protein n=1 Tax=Pseudomonas sp. S35 TaxID=1573719 RepID=UPI00132EBEBB|nr:hypothetical protein [Pseudomonas sp. S35]QHF44927.1 hypothetical protein PspS35_14495 [Pseudomonas sp. S35]
MSFSSAVVFIWLPVNTMHVLNIGHAAMYIGDPRIDGTEECRYKDYESSMHRIADIENIEKRNTNYVSWWPAIPVRGFNTESQKRKLFLESDLIAEGQVPHLVYRVYGLDVANMRNEWFKIRNKPDAHFQMLRKNCSTIVFRVLKAGGALDKLPTAKHIWFANNLYLAPLNIMQICNELCDINMAHRRASRNCPSIIPSSTLPGGSLSAAIRLYRHSKRPQ